MLGVPPRSLLDGATRKRMFFDSANQPRIVPNSRGKRRRPATKDMATALRCSDPVFLSFISGCLRWDPRERFTPEEALQHEWIVEGPTASVQRASAAAGAGSAAAAGSSAAAAAAFAAGRVPQKVSSSQYGGALRCVAVLSLRLR